MEARHINPFLEALKNTLQQFGVEDIKRGKIEKKDTMTIGMDITSVIGIVGDIRGNISYSLSQHTAKKIISTMMMGMEVETIDAMGRSAIGELSNMITGMAASILESDDVIIDISPPSIIFGSEVYLIISRVETLSIIMETPFGYIEVNIGLEV